MTDRFLGRRFHPECLRGSPRNRFSRIVVQEERGTLGWFNFCAKAPISTSSLPPFAAVVCGSHRPRTCTRASFGCLWCIFPACFLPRTRQPAAVAVAHPPSPARNHRLQQQRQTAHRRRTTPGWRAGHASSLLWPDRIGRACAATHGDAGTPLPPSPTTHGLVLCPAAPLHATEDEPRRHDVPKR